MSVEVRSPFPEHSIPRIWGWMQRFRSRVADDFGPGSLEEFVDWFLGADQRTWGVYRDGELGGVVVIQPQNPIAVVSHCIFKREFWGRKTTRPALEQVYREVFDSGVLRIGARIFADNQAIKALALEMGAKQEGTTRDATMRGGKPVDMIGLGLLREDFYGSISGGTNGGVGDHRRAVGAVEQPDVHE